MSFVCGSGISANVVFSEGDFQVDTIFFKNMIKQGDSVSGNLRVSNSGESSELFRLRVEGIEEMVNLSEFSFEIGAGESRDVDVLFYGNGFAPGVYVGRLIVESDSEKIVPIILEIQSEEVLFATNLEVGAKYKEVFRGGDVSVSTRLFNLNDTFLHDVEMNYLVKNFDGETIVSEVESVVVGTEVLISKNIVLPSDIEFGDYAFIVVAKFGNSVSTSSYLFSVVEAEDEGSFFVGDSGYFALIIIAFLVVIVILVTYLIYERGQMFKELRRQNRAELRMCAEKFEEKKKVLLLRARNEVERRRVKRGFARTKSLAVGELKRRHRNQRKEFGKLVKHRDKGLMKKKMSEWKKEGFRFGDEISRMKFSEKGRDEQMRKWRGQGFKA